MTKNYTIEDHRYSKAQACAYMSGLDQTTLDKWVALAKFPKPNLYLGRDLIWKLSTVNAYLSQKEEQYQSCN